MMQATMRNFKQGRREAVMDNGIKHKVTKEQLSLLMEQTFGVAALEAEELSDGWANTAYRVELSDGKTVIVKVAPQASVKMMSYEKGLMKTEVDTLRRMKEMGGIPVPTVLAYAADDGNLGSEYFIMEKLEGTPYNKVKDSLSEAERYGIEFELGVYNRRINELVGERFGLYADSDDEQGNGGSWRETFHKLILSVLEDGRAADVALPVDYDTIEHEVAARLDCLDEVTVPRLVHWDLWDGNVFVEDGRITGIIDFERALWGDPLMEVYFGRFNHSTGFLQGYGIGELTSAEKNRKALYSLYLDLILAIECAYRLYEDGGHIAWTRDNLAQGWQQFLQQA
ncbi:phosphotransferase family protein [Paenibacillus harenae]|uniref:Aminoglycoside phosphotransferase (APT) family kinase protein n=1 Tax=Paenibacillus harenae TaxID=306543 RepID=A0ABT9U159_PAEHA|nr:aminoglycoside phosphotransferase family protein [Paenibacillus harenae]MDQ0112405.1 aminoglycoside phosphotransferase (APT) family kinase protein [Paenibacillus harenae]